MAEEQIKAAEHEAYAARKAVEDDLAALGAAIRDDKAAVRRRARDNALAGMAGAAALGLFAGATGLKGVKWLLAAGAAAAGIAVYVRRRERLSH